MDNNTALKKCKKAGEIANEICEEFENIMQKYCDKQEEAPMQIAILLSTIIKFTAHSLLRVNDAIIENKFDHKNPLEEHKIVVFQEIDKLLKEVNLH